MKWEWHKDKRIELLNDHGDKQGRVKRKFERDSKTGVRHAMWIATIDRQSAIAESPRGRVWRVLQAETKKFRNLTDAKEWMLSSLVARKLEHGL